MPVPRHEGQAQCIATVAASAASQGFRPGNMPPLWASIQTVMATPAAPIRPAMMAKKRDAAVFFGKHRAAQVRRAPFGTSASGAASTMSPAASAKPSTSTSERTGPIWRGGKFTTAITRRPGSSSSV